MGECCVVPRALSYASLEHGYNFEVTARMGREAGGFKLVLPYRACHIRPSWLRSAMLTPRPVRKHRGNHCGCNVANH